MAGKSDFTREERDEAVARAARGERVVEIARDIGVGVSNLYAWIAAAKGRSEAAENGDDAGINSQKYAASKPKYTPPTVEEQITNLTADYQAKLKELLIKQITNNLRNM